MKLMKLMKLLKSYKKNFNLLLFIGFIFFTSGCLRQTAYFFFNTDYFFLFKEDYAIQEIVKKKLNRNFFKVKEIRLKALIDIQDELIKLKKNKDAYLVFLNNQLAPLLSMDNEITENSSAGLITYNTFKLENEPKIPVFNITINYSIIEKKIISFLRLNSSKNDLSDCGIIADENYPVCSEIISNLEKKKFKIEIFKFKTNEANREVIKTWMQANKKKIIVLFTFENNKFFCEFMKPDNIKFIEIITNFGEYSAEFDYRLIIDWQLVIKHAINSNDFSEFIKSFKLNKNTGIKKVINCPVDKDDTVYIKKTDADEIRKIIKKSENIKF